MKRALLVLVATLALLVAAPVAQAAPRVVALTPFTANTLAIFGVTPLAIGQTVGGGEHFSRRLSEVQRLPIAHPNGPNLEQVAVLDPQLVLSAPVWKKGNDQMRQLGTRVVEIDPRKVSDVPKATRWIGALVGLPRSANALAAKQRQHVRAAVSRARSHPRVLLVLGVGRAAFSFLPNSWGGDVVEQAGGKLITDGLRASGGYARISDEYVISARPGRDHRRAPRQPGRDPAADDVPALEPGLEHHEGGAHRSHLRLERQRAAAAVDEPGADDRATSSRST